MAYVATPWGYDVDGDVPPILTLERFHEMTANAFVSDARIQHAIDAATATMRSFCGWHVATSMSCEATLDGGTRSLWLPATHVTDVESVTVCGEDVTSACQWSRMGLLRLPRSPDVLRAVVVRYTAGLPEVPGELEGLLCHRVIHEVALPYGIQSQTIGSTSMTFAANAVDGTGTCHLSVGDKAALRAYRRGEVG